MGAAADLEPPAPLPGPGPLRLPSASIEQVLACEAPVLIDLRSPGEFAEDHLPGARSLPLFDDLERALVGTLYKQHSPETAFSAGFELAQGRIAELVAAIAGAAGRTLDAAQAVERMRALGAGGQRALEGRLQTERLERLPPGSLVLNCWRGGLRSQAVVALLHCLGLPAVLLEGGYRSWRQRVSARLAAASWPRAFVLRGLTGVGKTLVLREVERQRPGSSLDLEAVARHRSSILGRVGLEPVSQKAFDAGLALRFAAGFPHGRQGPWFVVEGESRKVGAVTQPESLWRALESGVAIELVAPTAVRVRNLLQDYLEQPGARAELAEPLRFIEQRLGRQRLRGGLVERLEDGREAELVELLLEHYYDPLYRHSEAGQVYRARIDSSDPARAAQQVLAFVEAHADGTAELEASSESSRPAAAKPESRAPSTRPPA